MPSVVIDSSYSGPSPFLTTLIFNKKWSTSEALTFYIEPADWDQNGQNDWIQTGYATALRSAYASLAAVCNLQIVEVASSDQANYIEQVGFPFSGGANFHSLPSEFTGIGSLNFMTGGGLWGVGQNSYVTMLHELGHGLGLVHPHSGQSINFPGVVREEDPGDFDLNNQLYTVMSYLSINIVVGSDALADWGWIATPMAFDIAAIQAMYGANMSANTGANVYDIPTVNALGTNFKCIWDAGGTDTIRYTGSGSCTIDLRAATLANEPGGGGYLSRADGIYGGFTIANGVVIETALGGSGADTIIGNDVANTLNGSGGNDLIRGGLGADQLTGGSGADTFVYHSIAESTAAQRDTILDFAVGTDRIDLSLLDVTQYSVSQSGGQTILSATSVAGTLQVVVNGNFTLDQLLPVRIAPILGDNAANVLGGSAGVDRLFGYDGNDSIDAGDGDDLLIGGNGNDQLQGGNGNDRIYGGTGSDGLIDSTGNDTLFGGAGDDVLYGELGSDWLYGGDGTDQLFGGAGADFLDPGAGNDTIDGGTGYDTLVISDAAGTTSWVFNFVGTSGGGNIQHGSQMILVSSIEAVLLDLGSGADRVFTPLRGKNTVYGGGGNDDIHGGLRDDVLYGGDGNDFLDGSFGFDFLDGGAGDDVLNGDAGNDRAVYASAGAAVTVDLRIAGAQNTGSAGNDTLIGIEDLVGSSFADTLIGDSQANYLDGGAGDDRLTGGGGFDRIEGGAGVNDFAVYSGNRADYLILEAIIDGILHFRVIGQGAAASDGNDLLSGVEFLRFADIDMRISNSTPTLGSSAIPDQNVGDGLLFTYQVPNGAFVDADNDPLTFTATLADGSALPTWLIFNPASRTFSGTPPLAAIGSQLQVRVTAADNVPGHPSSAVSDVFALSIFQSPGADITGTAVTDSIVGTFRDERMFGLEGDDRLYGSAGADLLDGGNGVDIVDYSTSAGGVTVNLALNFGQGGEAQGDTYGSIETVFGSSSADVLTGSGNADTLFGDAGDDVLNGGSGSDSLAGGDGADILNGGSGNDLIDGGAGQDQLNGGDGDDTYWLYAGLDDNDVIFENLNEGVDRVTTSLASYTLAANVEDLSAFGPSSPRNYTGNDLNNVISGFLSDDMLSGGGGNDTIHGEAGDDWLDGGSGDDALIGGLGNDTYVIDSAGDSITDIGGTDHVRTSLLYYVLAGGLENLTFVGSGNAVLTGNQAINVLTGGSSNDTLNGGGNVDTLIGNSGNDRLIVTSAGSGTNIDGGADTDTLAVSAAVTLGSVAGIEAIEFNAGASLTLTGTQASAGLALNTAVSGSGSLVINMDPGVATLTKLFVFSGSGVSVTVNGTAGTDLMKLGNVAHIANGGDGIDQIKGGSAADTINGGAGADKINGAGGADILTGGTGNDVFKYANASDSGLGAASDRITDFAIGQDRLNFVRIDADAVTAGDQAFTFLGTAAFAATGLGQLRYLTSGADLIVQADVNGDGVADMEVILQGIGGQVLTGADFVL